VLNKFSDYPERAIHKLKYYARRISYVSSAANLTDQGRAVIAHLQQEGVCVTALDQLTPDTTETFWQAIDRVLPQVPEGHTIQFQGQRHAASHSTCLNHATLVNEAPELFLWGLHPDLLSIVEHHLRQPVAYLGAMLRRDVPANGQVGNRLWHLDGEDHKVVKVIVYLNDVDAQGGAFEYIPKALISPSYKYFRHGNHLIHDEEMHQVLPKQHWQACVGTKGSVVIADTTSVFHHGKLPQRDRLTMMYAYTSTDPRSKATCKKFFPYAEDELLLAFAHQLSKPQITAAIGWR
jgi:hypothetical protein